MIDWVPTLYADIPRKDNLVPGATYALAKNIANVNITGFELDLVYKKQFSNSVGFYSTAGFVLLHTESNNSVPSFYISSHAKQLLNFNTILTVKSFSISLNGIYKKRKAQNASSINATITQSYFILNGKLGYILLKNKLQFYFEADNVFNNMYSDLLGSKMPGSWVSGGFQITL